MPRHPYLDGPYPRAYAHRGWHIDDLAGCENTLAAFRRAVDEGFGYLEMDVHASADGVAGRPPRRHARTAPPTAAVRSAPAPPPQLADVRVRGREPLPLLEQVLTELPDTRMTIELKSDAVVEPVLERAGAHRQLAPGVPGQLLRQAAAPGPGRGRAAAVHLDGAGRGGRAAQRGPGSTRCRHRCDGCPPRRSPATSPSSPGGSAASPWSTPPSCALHTRPAGRCTCGPSTWPRR